MSLQITIPPKTPARLSPRQRILAISEIVVALSLFAWVLLQPGLRSLLLTGAHAIGGGALSLFTLLPDDPGTLLPACVTLIKISLLLLPALRMLLASPRRRLAWIPLGSLVFIAVLGNAIPGITGGVMWSLFFAASIIALIAVKRPALRLAFLLPWLVALEPLLGHSPLSDTAWPTSRLAAKCASHDGARPADFRPELASTRYYGVTPLSPDLMLLTGERRSYWVRRNRDNTTRLGEPIDLRGNFWQGCVKDGTVWLTSRARICEATPPRNLDTANADTRPRYACHDLPGPAEAGAELDYVDVVCPPSAPGVFVSQLLRGGLIEYQPKDGTSRWHPVMPGLNLQVVARKGGKLTGITTSRLFVFDPATDRVLEDHPAGLVAMGIDVCPTDDTVAVADFTGRLRLFERAISNNQSNDDNGYRFIRGKNLPAARRVAFSPDCAHIAVTSGDDRHAWLLRRSDLTILRIWSLGPGLRDIVFLDNQTVAAADACTINLLDASPLPK